MGKDTSPDSLLHTIIAISRLLLMLIGIIGLSVEIFRDNGWLNQLLAKILSSPAGLISVPIGLAVLYFFNRWLTTASDGSISKGDLPLYLMMAIGAYFLFNLITTGSF
ncbi:MAG TPA: hypothetical protein VIE91_04855 [Methylophilaceae bacterium]|jgi:hypothetical protein